MKLLSDWLGFAVLFDACIGGTCVVIGIGTTFANAYLGWGLIAGGGWLLLHFYFLVWGVEKALKGGK